MLVNLVVLFFLIILVVLSLTVSTLNKLTFKALNHTIEIDSIVAKDGKLAFVCRIEFNLAVILWLARELSLWLYSKLLVLL